MKIISGGQTGADIAGLKIAKKHGFSTGGYIPKNFKTLTGDKPEYKELYGMQETITSDYPTRTELNAKESDATIWFGENRSSYGKLCTFKYIKKYKKPYKDIDIDNPTSIEDIVKWIKDNKFNTINIAGNSETSTNNIETRVSEYLDNLFTKLS